MKTIVISSNKGGSNKTTTALALADVLCELSYNTLFMDLDLQCNSTDVYKAKIKDEYTIFDVILAEEKTDINKAIQHNEVKGVRKDIIAGDPLVKKSDVILNTDSIGGAYRLRTAIKTLEQDKYDFLIIDTSPAINPILYNALIIADYVITPVTADRFSIAGISNLSSVFSQIKEVNDKFSYLGILMTKYHNNRTLDKAVLNSLITTADNMGTRVFDTKIRECDKVRQAQSLRKPLYEYARNCTSARDYWNFTEELLNIIGDK